MSGKRKHRLLCLAAGMIFLFLLCGMSASAKTGLVKSGNNWYYYTKSGVMARNTWVSSGGNKYYASSDGTLLTGGLYKVGEYYYLFTARGARRYGKITYKKKTYYFHLTNGRMQKSKWVKIDGYYYYFGSDGVLVTSSWVGRYYVGALGRRQTSKWKGKRYLGSDGKAVTGLQQIDGVYYYFSTSTWKKVTNTTKTVDGDTWQFDSNGVGTLVSSNKAPATSVSVETAYYTDLYVDEETLLSAVIYCEAGNQSYAGKLAVGMVVLNRVKSSLFPSTIREVIYQKGQFYTSGNTALTKTLAGYETIVTDSCRQAAAEVIAMYDGYTSGSTIYLTVDDSEVEFPYLFFMTRASYISYGLTAPYITIGAHVFFETWK